MVIGVGRNADNVIALEFNGVSRYHFKLIASGENHILEDCGSKNGTYLNNKKVSVEKNYFMEEILRTNYPNIKLQVVDSTKKALELAK